MTLLGAWSLELWPHRASSRTGKPWVGLTGSRPRCLAAGASPAEPGVSRSSWGRRPGPPQPGTDPASSGPWPRPRVQKGPWACLGRLDCQDLPSKAGASGRVLPLPAPSRVWEVVWPQKAGLSLLSVYPSASRGQAVTEQLGVHAVLASLPLGPFLRNNHQGSSRRTGLASARLLRRPWTWSGPRVPADRRDPSVAGLESPHPVCLSSCNSRRPELLPSGWH